MNIDAPYIHDPVKPIPNQIAVVIQAREGAPRY